MLLQLCTNYREELSGAFGSSRCLRECSFHGANLRHQATQMKEELAHNARNCFLHIISHRILTRLPDSASQSPAAAVHSTRAHPFATPPPLPATALCNNPAQRNSLSHSSAAPCNCAPRRSPAGTPRAILSHMLSRNIFPTRQAKIKDIYIFASRSAVGVSCSRLCQRPFSFPSHMETLCGDRVPGAVPHLQVEGRGHGGAARAQVTIHLPQEGFLGMARGTPKLMAERDGAREFGGGDPVLTLGNSSHAVEKLYLF